MLFKEELSDIFIESALIDILFDYYWSVVEFVMFYHESVAENIIPTEGSNLIRPVLNNNIIFNLAWLIKTDKLLFANKNLLIGSDYFMCVINLTDITITAYTAPIYIDENESMEYVRCISNISKLYIEANPKP